MCAGKSPQDGSRKCSLSQIHKDRVTGSLHHLILHELNRNIRERNPWDANQNMSCDYYYVNDE